MPARKFVLLTLFSFLVISSLAAAAPQGEDSALDIPYQKFVLDNGLTLVVHEDHKAPIVAVNVWYHVGSKNEKPGKSGFAHLFEHLMFNGSENFNDDYFQVMERIGATDLNGTTNEDRTNYFQNVPTSALDIALWMESDRMGHLLGAVDQAKLDEQRGVVQNEKRQYENEPYGVAYELMTFSTWPKGHPYSWSVIGSMEDLDAASLEDVHEWFKTYYGPSNAVIVLAGDIDPRTAFEKVKHYFGDIPPGPPVARHSRWIAKRSGEHRQSVQDRVPAARVYKVWNIPQWGTRELAYLDLASDILSVGKTSRFYKRLIYEDQTASNVRAYLDVREIACQFVIEATAKPGEDLAKIEKAIDEELSRFLAEGPAEKELQRVKTQFRARFIRGIERIGGFGGKSDILAQNEVYGGSPDFYKKYHAWVNGASLQDIKSTSGKWLSDGVYVLEVHPFPELQASDSGAERVAGKLPEAGEPPAAKFPELQRAALSNGLKVVLAKRQSVPLVNFNLMVDAGYAADQFAIPGTASLAMNMLDEGTEKRSALEINEELSMLGANLNTRSNLDISSVSLSALKNNLNAALDIYADVLLNPAFPENELERLKKERISTIKQEKASPFPMALRVLPQFIYGKDHAYGNPFTGSGTEESVTNMRREDLRKFHKTWFKPNNATLVVVGDITLNEVVDLLEKRFKNWKSGDVPGKNIGTVAHKTEPVIYVMDRPGALQSLIIAGQAAPPKANPEEIAIECMNNILGGQFVSRVNMNLREDKHWSYGAFTFLIDARGQRPFMVYASVQTDKTKESVAELQKELKDILSTRPPTEQELSRVTENMILELPGSWETNNEVGCKTPPGRQKPWFIPTS
jgi:zinc protease